MIKNSPIISVISPVYRAENIIPELLKQLHESFTSITSDYEIILVNDSSPDNSWQAIVAECEKDERVKGIDLSRNFGQHYAITAGLNYSQGNWIVVMDCDLQDKPEEIPNLYRKAQEGYDSVFAQRIKRKDSFSKRLFSKIFYAIFSYLTDTKQDSTVANFGIYHRKVIDAILAMKDNIRYFPTMIQWVGFRKYYLPVQHAERYEGKTSYNLKALTKLAINNILAFSDKPLRLTVKLGFIISCLSFFLAIYNIVAHFAGIIRVEGFTTTVFSIWFVAGLILVVLGIVGLYVGKTFENIKRRPTFIVNDKINI
jgi:dolichol-phosphate mannosyltransferase